mgnify:CR=1 FL=1
MGHAWPTSGIDLSQNRVMSASSSALDQHTVCQFTQSKLLHSRHQATHLRVEEGGLSSRALLIWCRMLSSQSPDLPPAVQQSFGMTPTLPLPEADGGGTAYKRTIVAELNKGGLTGAGRLPTDRLQKVRVAARLMAQQAAPPKRTHRACGATSGFRIGRSSCASCCALARSLCASIRRRWVAASCCTTHV